MSSRPGASPPLRARSSAAPAAERPQAASPSGSAAVHLLMRSPARRPPRGPDHPGRGLRTGAQDRRAPLPHRTPRVRVPLRARHRAPAYAVVHSCRAAPAVPGAQSGRVRYLLRIESLSRGAARRWTHRPPQCPPALPLVRRSRRRSCCARHRATRQRTRRQARWSPPLRGARCLSRPWGPPPARRWRPGNPAAPGVARTRGQPSPARPLAAPRRRRRCCAT